MAGIPSVFTRSLVAHPTVFGVGFESRKERSHCLSRRQRSASLCLGQPEQAAAAANLGRRRATCPGVL